MCTRYSYKQLIKIENWYPIEQPPAEKSKLQRDLGARKPKRSSRDQVDQSRVVASKSKPKQREVNLFNKLGKEKLGCYS